VEGDEGLTSPSYNQSTNQKVKSFAEWADELCPYYMALGVPYNDYWYGDYTMLPYYIKAHEMRNAQRNQELWMQGLYIHDAMSIVMSNAFRKKSDEIIPYPKEPYPITKEEADNRAESKRIEALQVAKAKFEAWSETLELNREGVKDACND
jgi:hypothetical protein